GAEAGNRGAQPLVFRISSANSASAPWRRPAAPRGRRADRPPPARQAASADAAGLVDGAEDGVGLVALSGVAAVEDPVDRLGVDENVTAEEVEQGAHGKVAAG